MPLEGAIQTTKLVVELVAVIRAIVLSNREWSKNR